MVQVPLFIVVAVACTLIAVWLTARVIAAIKDSSDRNAEHLQKARLAFADTSEHISRLIGVMKDIHASVAPNTERVIQESAAMRISMGLVYGEVSKLPACLAAIVTSINPAAEELRLNMAAVPKLLEVISKVGTAQLEIMQSQRPKTPPTFGKSNSTPRRDTESANLEYDVLQAMRTEGISREEAMMRMNPANMSSPWEGHDGLLDGWRR